MSMRPVGQQVVERSTSRWRFRLIVIFAAAIVAVSLFAVLGVSRLTDRPPVLPPSCTPPTQEEKELLEAFLRSHIKDARALEWTVADCDDNGDASLDFETRMTPKMATASFLADDNCSPFTGPGATDGDVTCTTAAGSVSIFLASATAITRGELAF
jgi:hypothetical protein